MARTTTMRQPQNQQDMISRRLPIVIGFLILLSALLLVALARYQLLSPDVEREFVVRGEANTSSVRRIPAERGVIYDRDGQPMAINTIQYEIGVSPNLILEKRDVARQLALILEQDEFDLYQRLLTNSSWEQIARPVTADVGQAIAELDLLGVIINPLSQRSYPQTQLAAPVIGFVIEDNDNTRGALGVEGSYNDQLAGRVIDQEVSNIPFEIPLETRETRQRGMDVVLTIDRDIQFWAETELQRALEQYNSPRGAILIMDPRNGDILAMASAPTFDPNNFIQVEDPALLRNSTISDSYEPGSVMKVLTVAGALEKGVITPEWTYTDQGRLDIGGITVENWDDRAYGLVDTTTALVRSLNVGMATIAIQMGPEDFYAMLGAFGIGQPTRVDLPGEEAGILKVPGDDWSESDLATNSFGQGVSVTPLQMLTAVNAIANDGLMMQPRVVRQIVDGDQVINAQPSARRAISAETARIVADMMVRVVEDPNGAPLARLDGYTIAGKTGTAQIPTPTGYSQNESITTFVGFFPADDPQVSVLIMLDRPNGYWGSQTAAPVFRRLAERLVILMGIPNDEIRRNLREEGGVVNDS
jgi:cell division protein FtsI/penicillin-binding protein 2